LDWVTIVVYLLLIVFGWFSVCGASYDYGDRDFLDFSTRAGKQFVWIICSFGLGFVLLMLDDSLYDMFSRCRIISNMGKRIRKANIRELFQFFIVNE
jgi:rod shape determining protein RodA